ncbi:MAG: hypothetical protein EBY17_11715 [Acidobacteriia bacterium]|nr:hypothetical protein [Terriglobia bacterium]
MPHLRLEVPAEWLTPEFREATGFHAEKLLAVLVQTVAGLTMVQPDSDIRLEVPMIQLRNLKHAIIPVYGAGVGGDTSQQFLHITLAAGNDTPGRTAKVRYRAAEALGRVADEFTAGLPGLASITVHIQDIDRSRGYSTTAERRAYFAGKA